MDTIVLQGTLLKGPLGASDCGAGGTTTIPFNLNPSQKQAPASFQASKNINSPSAFVALDGVGPTETVTQGNTLFLMSSSVMQYRLTIHPDSGPDFTSVIYAQGLFILELPSGNYLALLEVKGVGQLTYLVSGNL